MLRGWGSGGPISESWRQGIDALMWSLLQSVKFVSGARECERMIGHGSGLADMPALKLSWMSRHMAEFMAVFGGSVFFV